MTTNAKTYEQNNSNKKLLTTKPNTKNSNRYFKECRTEEGQCTRKHQGKRDSTKNQSPKPTAMQPAAVLVPAKLPNFNHH